MSDEKVHLMWGALFLNPFSSNIFEKEYRSSVKDTKLREAIFDQLKITEELLGEELHSSTKNFSAASSSNSSTTSSQTSSSASRSNSSTTSSQTSSSVSNRGSKRSHQHFSTGAVALSKTKRSKKSKLELKTGSMPFYRVPEYVFGGDADRSTSKRTTDQFERYMSMKGERNVLQSVNLPQKKPFWCFHMHVGVLNWWKHRISLFPDLQKIARKYLTFMPSAALSEKVWSRSGSIWSDLRFCLSEEYLVSATCFSMMYALAKRNKDNDDLKQFISWVTEDVNVRSGYEVPQSASTAQVAAFPPSPMVDDDDQEDFMAQMFCR
mmetsp:Transcript_13793/g.20799  ORF Transcript_13793/g.20799 Transcript_13793/m.20799 type:complete len:322 (-) Transcript_13793:66-1031(-)